MVKRVIYYKNKGTRLIEIAVIARKWANNRLPEYLPIS